LTKAIRVVHEEVTDGTLELIETRDFGPEGRVLDFREGGPWKEFLRIRLKCCACQQSLDHSLCGDLSRWLAKARADVA
jgi:hypothetical protein